MWQHEGIHTRSSVYSKLLNRLLNTKTLTQNICLEISVWVEWKLCVNGGVIITKHPIRHSILRRPCEKSQFASFQNQGSRSMPTEATTLLCHVTWKAWPLCSEAESGGARLKMTIQKLMYLSTWESMRRPMEISWTVSTCWRQMILMHPWSSLI